MVNLQLIISGVAIGCIYALIAMGFVLIYKATETVNFAQGEVMMFGAFAALILTFSIGLPFWLAVIVALVGMAGFGAMVERLAIRPILGQPQFVVVMLTIGLGYVLRGIITMLPGYGADTHMLNVPYQGILIGLGPLVIGAEQLVIIGVTVVLCLMLFALFRYTRVGVAMQAVSQNQLAAYYMGIPVRRLNSLVWALAAAVATLAGILLAPITFVHAYMGLIGMKAFPAAVIGGFTSLPGAVVGGLIIGLSESFAGFYLPEGFKDVAPYIVVLIMLAIKPTGLFGGTTRKRV